MKTKTYAMIAAAALGGLIVGSANRASASPVPSTPVVGAHSRAVSGVAISHDAGVKAKALDDDNKDKHDCKGANDCKGKGGCKSGDNGCKGKNSCKGKGGCNTDTSTK